MPKAFSVILIIAVVVPDLAAGEPFSLTIPGQGWSIGFEAPSLIQFVGQTKDKAFQFRAVGEAGFNLSVFAEEPKGKSDGHEECFDYYWPRAKRNPMIDQESVTVTKTERYVKVSYNLKVGEGAKQIMSPHVNYYFRFQDRWIDVHVSRYPPNNDDKAVLEVFEKGLSYKKTKAE